MGKPPQSFHPPICSEYLAWLLLLGCDGSVRESVFKGAEMAGRMGRDDTGDACSVARPAHRVRPACLSSLSPSDDSEFLFRV